MNIKEIIDKTKTNGYSFLNYDLDTVELRKFTIVKDDFESFDLSDEENIEDNMQIARAILGDYSDKHYLYAIYRGNRIFLSIVKKN